MEYTQNIQKDDDVIDLLGLLRALKKRLWLIILCALIGGSGAWAYSHYMLTPQYTASAMLYVLSNETTLTSIADLTIGSQLSADYKTIINTRPVLKEVINQLGVDMTYRQLRGKLTIANEEGTRILTLTVVDPDPQMAKRIVDQVAVSASDYIGDIMEMIPPKIIEDGEVSYTPIAPNHKKNTLLGIMVGIALVCGIVTVRFLMNDTVRTEEDVERYLGLPVLAAIPKRSRQRRNKNQGDSPAKESQGKR
ncbi:MAG: polysaccharide export protein [Lachnospiraceae bacterium]|jgi:capsular polysaccharide biosynthesis protein|nr:polysaccharide export protein [Lachnospiraceae bacterium]